MKTQAILSFLFLLSLYSCKKDEVYTPHLKGSIIGSAFLYDEFGVMLNDNSGIKVTAEGYGRYTGSTDYYGRFELKDIPTGTYIVSAEKEGFGKIKKYSVKHLGGSPTCLNSSVNYGRESFSLIVKSTLKIQEVNITKDTLLAKIDLPANMNLRYLHLRLYYSTEPNVNTRVNIYNDVHFATYVSGNSYKALWLNNFGFPPGTKLYSKACVQIVPESQLTSFRGSSYSSYEDPETHQIIIPNLGDASTEFTFIVPE